MVAGITPRLDPFHPGNPFPPGLPGLAAAALTARVSTETDTRLTIMTAEGDKVTLTSHLEVRAAFATYDFRGREISLGQDVRLAVEGDPNAEELTGIRKLVKDLDGVVRDFLKGDLEKAAGRSLRIEAAESVVGFGLSVLHSEEVAATRAVAVQTAGPASPGAAPPTAPSGPEVTGDQAQDELVERVVEAFRGARAAAPNLRKLFPRLIADVLRRLEHDPAAGHSRPLLRDFNDRVWRKLEEPDPPPIVPEPPEDREPVRSRQEP